MESDVYGKTLKTRLSSIMPNKFYQSYLLKYIHKACDIKFVCNYFCNSYILCYFNQNKNVPIINENFFKIAFNVLSKPSRGPKPKNANLILFNELSLFFEKEFVHILPNPNLENINENKFDSKNLSYVFSMFSKDMDVAFKNNIVLNFFKYVHQFVNQNFIKRTVLRMSKEDFKKLTHLQQIEYRKNKSEECDRIKNLKRELFLVKNDLIEETFKSDKKYHEWIEENAKLIFPQKSNNKLSYEEDITINHNKYLKHMLLMNDFLEKTNDTSKKLFTALPLTTEICDKYVHFDSTSIKDIFNSFDFTSIPYNEVTHNMFDECINLNGTAGISNEKIWEIYFNIDPYKFKLKGYSFNYRISTNGIAVSINFINDDKIESKNNKIKAMTTASKNARTLYKTLTNEEVCKIKEEKEKATQQKKIESIEKAKQLKKEKREEFKKMSEEEKNKIRLKIKLESNKFEYIEDAVKDPELYRMLKNAHENGKLKVADPGSRDLLTILGDCKVVDIWDDENEPIKKRKRYGKRLKKKGKVGKTRRGKTLYSYRSGRRIKETRRLKDSKLIGAKKISTVIKNKSIADMEKELVGHNSKTVNYEKFKKYAKIKLGMRKLISNFEKSEIEKNNKELRNNFVKNGTDEIFNELIENGNKLKEMNLGTTYNEYITRMKWYSYINKKRHEDKILNEIENVYGEDAIFIIGDWGGKGKIKRISTPNMGLKKLLSRRFKVFLIDEFRTSKIHHETEKKCENLMKPIKYGVDKVYKKKVHSVLTFKKSKKEMGCINRDYNACLNMLKIVNELIRTKKRPEIYDRSMNIKID